MLALAAEHLDGALPYLGTPEHTAQVREILGPDRDRRSGTGHRAVN